MKHLGEDFVLGAECHRAPFLHGEKEINAGNGAWAVRYHNRYPAARANAENGSQTSETDAGRAPATATSRADQKGE